MQVEISIYDRGDITMSVAANTREQYKATMQKVQELLTQNPEWRDRYAEYIKKLSEIPKQLQAAQRQFSVPAPFQLYLSISMAMKCNSRSTYFELRFHGRSVAEIAVSNQEEKKVDLHVKNVPAILKALETAKLGTEADQLRECVKQKKMDWHSEQARQFRALYSELEKSMKSNPMLLPGQPEHDMESALLQNYAQKRSDGKELLDIQPVTIKGTSARFQMPTPLRTSSAKNGIEKIEYSRQYGGGIDILARMGRGRGTTLAVLELKDENKSSEPPEKAICQAIAYATFLRELLRSDCGQDWWQFFGFGGSVPKALELKTIIVMPNEPNTSIAFGGEELTFKDSEDKIRLEYIYRANPKNGLPQVTSIQ